MPPSLLLPPAGCAADGSRTRCTPRNDQLSCVDGPRPARVFHAGASAASCGHVYGLLMRRDMAAGPDGNRGSRPDHCGGVAVPDDSGWLPSIAGLTDIAITRVHPGKPSGPVAVSCSSRRRPAAEVLLAPHQRPADARQLIGQGHRHHLARLAGEPLGDPRISPGVLRFDQRCCAVDQEPA